jgi:hypothetical protein
MPSRSKAKHQLPEWLPRPVAIEAESIALDSPELRSISVAPRYRSPDSHSVGSLPPQSTRGVAAALHA